MAHYAYIYFRNVPVLLNTDDSMNRVEVIIPTGACGNITGMNIHKANVGLSF